MKVINNKSVAITLTLLIIFSNQCLEDLSYHLLIMLQISLNFKTINQDVNNLWMRDVALLKLFEKKTDQRETYMNLLEIPQKMLTRFFLGTYYTHRHFQLPLR